MSNFLEKLQKGMKNKIKISSEKPPVRKKPIKGLKPKKTATLIKKIKPKIMFQAAKKTGEKIIKKSEKKELLLALPNKIEEEKEKTENLEYKTSQEIIEEKTMETEKKEAEMPKQKIEVIEEKSEKKEELLPSSLSGVSENKSKSWFEPEGQLAIDVYQTDGEIVIQAAIAGIKPSDLDISIENDLVTIRGKREKTFEKIERNYFYQECYWGRFSREVILPAEVDASRTEASMKDGILTIRIPKIEREKKRKVFIKE